MKRFSQAPADIRRLFHSIRAEHHPDLARAKIEVLVVETNTEVEPIVTKVTGPTARAGGASDVVLVIDQAAWSEATDAERAAWIDNALAGLRVVHREGVLVVDAAGRPLIRRRKPAYRLAVHEDALQRHLEAIPGFGAVRSVERVVRRGKRQQTATATVGA